MRRLCTHRLVQRDATRSWLQRSLALVLGLTAFGVADADAYVVKKTSRGELVHWEQRTVAYTIDPSMAAVDSSIEATHAAMDSWSGTVGAPELVTRPLDEASPTKPTFDEKNGVFFMADGYEPAGRALAITVLTYDNGTGRILDADIVVNGSYRFAVLGDHVGNAVAAVSPSNTDGVSHEEEEEPVDTRALFDLHHVVAHEFGHSVGMNDELGRRDALMFRYSAPNDPSLREPAADDIAGLAELYSTKLEGRGNGCGANVAPKKPTAATTHLAMLGIFGLLLFLVLRGRTDRRARVGFVFAAATATVALLPTIAKTGRGVAHGSELAPGHARAVITKTSTVVKDGLFRTHFELATNGCQVSACPTSGHGDVWGGTIGDIRQEVGGHFAPESGDQVDVSFARLPNALAALSQPLGAQTKTTDEVVRVMTLAAR